MILLLQILNLNYNMRLFNNTEEFLHTLFSVEENLSIIQIGACDGVQNDPLYRYLKNNKGNTLLIETIPYYCDLLKNLYKNESHIKICNAHVSNDFSLKKFFYIEPSVADHMDGDGPNNKWAHGQGSTSKDTIVYWIYQNSFRGENYKKNIQQYIDSIKEISLRSKTLNDIIIEYNFVDGIDLLLLDVQGHEYSILQNITTLDKYPNFIVYEDDASMSKHDSNNLEKLLLSLDYSLIANGHDKTWTLHSLKW